MKALYESLSQLFSLTILPIVLSAFQVSSYLRRFSYHVLSPNPPTHLDWIPLFLTCLFCFQVLLTLQPVPPWMMTTAGTWMRTRSGKLSGATCRRGATLTWPTSSLLCLPRLVLGSSFIKKKIKTHKAHIL